MRLPVPGPRDVLAALERGGDQVEALLGAVPRALALLDQAEALLAERDGGGRRAYGPSPRTPPAVIERTRAVVDRAEVQVERVTELLDSLRSFVDHPPADPGDPGRDDASR